MRYFRFLSCSRIIVVQVSVYFYLYISFISLDVMFLHPDENSIKLSDSNVKRINKSESVNLTQITPKCAVTSVFKAAVVKLELMFTVAECRKV